MCCSDSDNWITAMQEELKSMQDKDIWDLVDLLDNFNPLGYKWVSKTKRDFRGNIKWF